MTAYFLFLIRWSVGILLLGIIYRLAVKNTTFHRLNRIVLLSIIPLSALLAIFRARTGLFLWEWCVPSVQVDWSGVEGLFKVAQPVIGLGVAVSVPSVASELQTGPVPESYFCMEWSEIFGTLYLLLVLFGLVCWGRSVYKLCHYVRTKCDVRRLGQIKLVLMNERVHPFSFAHCICISEYETKENFHLCVLHEIGHVRNLHFIDHLIVHFFALLNPVVLLLRHELREVHEYEADEYVMRHGVNKKYYQLLLLTKIAGVDAYALTDHFNNQSLKKRITMMNREKNNGWAVTRLLSLIPVAALLIWGFSQPVAGKEVEDTEKKVENRESKAEVHVPDISRLEGVWVHKCTVTRGREREIPRSDPNVSTMGLRIFDAHGGGSTVWLYHENGKLRFGAGHLRNYAMVPALDDIKGTVQPLGAEECLVLMLNDRMIRNCFLGFYEEWERVSDFPEELREYLKAYCKATDKEKVRNKRLDRKLKGLLD